MRPNYNVINQHPETAIKYEKKKFNIPGLKIKEEKEIIIYPDNPNKYSGCISPDGKSFRVIFNKQGFKYSKYFKCEKEANKHCIEIAKQQGFVKNLLYLKVDEKTNTEYYEMELQRKDLRTKININCFDLVDQHIYSEDKGYIYYTDEDTGKTIYLHNQLCETKENESVDHENRNSLDNRLLNLKSKTKGQQNINRSKFKNNTSGITGVHYNDKKKAWVSSYYTAPKIRKIKYFYVAKYKNKLEAFIYACIRRHNAELFFPYHHESTGIKWDGNYEFWN